MTERISPMALSPWLDTENNYTIELVREIIDEAQGNQIFYNKVEAKLNAEEYDHIMEFLKERIGNKNPNNKYKYCVYDTITNKIYHNLFELSIVDVKIDRKLKSINRFKHLIVLKKDRTEHKCACSILMPGVNITDIPLNKYLPVKYLLKSIKDEN